MGVRNREWVGSFFVESDFNNNPTIEVVVRERDFTTEIAKEIIIVRLSHFREDGTAEYTLGHTD